MGYGQLPVFSTPGSPGWISVFQGSDWIPPRKFILGENTVLFCLFLILLDSILSPAQLIIPALMLAIDISFLFSQSVNQLVQSFSHVRLFETPWIEAHQTSFPSPTPGVYSNSGPSSQWCHQAISSSVIPFSCPQSLPTSGSFPMSQLRMRWPKYWSFSFSISPSNEHPGLISLRVIQIQSEWQTNLSQKTNLSSIKRKTPTVMGWIFMCNTKFWSFKFKSSCMLRTIKSY